jgi:hypothetical protein
MLVSGSALCASITLASAVGLSACGSPSKDVSAGQQPNDVNVKGAVGSSAGVHDLNQDGSIFQEFLREIRCDGTF